MTRASGQHRLPATGTVARAVAVLRIVAESDGGTQIKRVSAALNLPASTVHRLLDLLSREGMVERDEDAPTYRVGRELLQLAARVVSEHPLQSTARPYLDQAVAAVNETAYFCVYLPREHRLSFATFAESTHPLGYRIRTNEPQSLLTGASGRSILAWLAADELAAVLVSEPGPDTRDLGQDLATIRDRGYAVSFGQRITGAVGIFAPVFAANGRVTGSLGFTIPEHRYQAARETEFTRCARKLAAELSASLGFQARDSA